MQSESLGTRHAEAIAGHLDFFYSEVAPPTAQYGQIARSEAEFLIHRVLDRRPRLMVEIGTAGGASTAHLLMARDLLGGQGRVVAIEALDHCYFDPSKPPAFLVERTFGVVPDRYDLHCGKTCLDLAGIVGGRRIELLFIDANHSHPWATMDTILALPFITEETLLVYHDINLHDFMPPQLGPHYLFHALSARDKIMVGDWPRPNIGALRLSRPPAQTVEELLRIMFMFPWAPAHWPVLDWTLASRFGLFLEEHWGRSLRRTFLKSVQPFLQS